MKLWAFFGLLAVCQARPDKLPSIPSQSYGAPSNPPSQPPPPPQVPFQVPQFPQPSPLPASFPLSPPTSSYGAPTAGRPQGGDLLLQTFTGSQGIGIASIPLQTQPQQQHQTPSIGTAPRPVSCSGGQVDKGDGTCVTPQITRNLFLYRVPDNTGAKGPAAVLPDPKVHYNFVFIRTADQAAGQQPIVIPPAQQKTLVYVLDKKQEALAQKFIQQESKPTQPEVYFVSYKDGDNLDLPGGVDLQTALSQSVLQGEIVQNPGNIGGTFSGGSSASGGTSGSQGFIVSGATSGSQGYSYNRP